MDTDDMSDQGAGIQVSKLDAARRQLDAALLLYFNEADPIGIHSLTAAAHGVLRDLSSKAGTHMPIEGSLLQELGPDFTKEVMLAMRRSQNFFKHADRDAESELEFWPQSTDLLLLDCAAKYFEMTGGQTILQKAYVNWCSVHYPQFWRGTKMAGLVRKASKDFGAMGRVEFLREFMTTAASLSSPGPMGGEGE